MTDRLTGPGPVSHEWQRWAAISLLAGMPLADVVAVMVAEGVPEGAAAQACARTYGNAFFEAGQHSAQQLRKLESVLDMLATMSALSAVEPSVDRRAELSGQQFLDEYYSLNRPVLLEDVCDAWPARGLWTLDCLADLLADEQVELVSGRADNSEQAPADRARHVSFDEFVSGDATADGGARGAGAVRCDLLRAGRAGPLWADFEEDPRYLVPDADGSLTMLSVAKAGSVTSLRHDLSNVLVQQVDGWLHVILVSPLESHLVYNTVGALSEVDAKAPDLQRHGRYERAHPTELSVGPGDALFVPAGWWHHVEAMDTSISVSSAGFAFENEIAWALPAPL